MTSIQYPLSIVPTNHDQHPVPTDASQSHLTYHDQLPVPTDTFSSYKPWPHWPASSTHWRFPIVSYHDQHPVPTDDFSSYLKKTSIQYPLSIVPTNHDQHPVPLMIPHRIPTMTSIQYPLLTSPSDTVVPFKSTIQNMASGFGFARTSHRMYTFLSPRNASLSSHVITAASETHSNLVSPRIQLQNIDSSRLMLCQFSRISVFSDVLH